MTTIIFLLILVFLIGMYFYAKNGDSGSDEGFTNNQSTGPRCPNLLIQKGSRFYLYNSKLAQVPGVNPVEFDNLEDYTEFLDWQRSQNIRCPVLFLQQAGLPPSAEAPIGIASQVSPMMETALEPVGEDAYPNPTLLVDATRNDPPYNQGSYPSHDQTSYYIGTTTPLDGMDMEAEAAKVSPNPMDPNWGGSEYTQDLVDKGYYKDNEVNIYIP